MDTSPQPNSSIRSMTRSSTVPRCLLRYTAPFFPSSISIGSLYIAPGSTETTAGSE